MQPKISLIIPTFNVESYIARCLESCINQTLHDIEILIIDDCGSDDSIQIAKDYASKDKRVKIIQNPKNLGAFASRIYGIKFAQGEYVAFLDADDYLNLNACEMMYQQVKYFAKNSQNTHKTCNTPDIVHFKAHYHVSHSNTSAPTLLSSLLHKIRYILPTRFSTKPLKNEQIAYNFFLKSSNFPKFTIWDKCYKASLVREAISYLESITYPLIMAEDMLKFFYIANLAKSYVSTPHRLYHYMLNTQSTTQNPRNKTKKIQDMRFIIEFLQCHCDVPNAPYAKQIAQKLSTNLASLIVLESRFDKLPKKQDSAGFVESTLSTFDAQDKKRDTQEFGVLDSCAKINNTNPNNANTDVLAGGGGIIWGFYTFLFISFSCSSYTTHRARLAIIAQNLAFRAIKQCIGNALSVCVYSVASILESLSYLYKNFGLYFHIWQAQDLTLFCLRIYHQRHIYSTRYSIDSHTKCTRMRHA